MLIDSNIRPSNAKRELEWRPRFAGISEGLSAVLAAAAAKRWRSRDRRSDDTAPRAFLARFGIVVIAILMGGLRTGLAGVGGPARAKGVRRVD